MIDYYGLSSEKWENLTTDNRPMHDCFSKSFPGRTLAATAKNTTTRPRTSVIPRRVGNAQGRRSRLDVITRTDDRRDAAPKRERDR